MRGRVSAFDRDINRSRGRDINRGWVIRGICLSQSVSREERPISILLRPEFEKSLTIKSRIELVWEKIPDGMRTPKHWSCSGFINRTTGTYLVVHYCTLSLSAIWTSRQIISTNSQYGQYKDDLVGKLTTDLVKLKLACPQFQHLYSTTYLEI